MEERLTELKSSPYFKREIEHDAREGVYENCVYHMKNGHEDFLLYGDGCTLHYYENGMLVERRTPYSDENNLQKLTFFNNDGKVVFEVDNFESQQATAKTLAPLHTISVIVCKHSVIVDENTFDGRLIRSTAYDVASGQIVELEKADGVQLSFDI